MGTTDKPNLVDFSFLHYAVDFTLFWYIARINNTVITLQKTNKDLHCFLLLNFLLNTEG